MLTRSTRKDWKATVMRTTRRMKTTRTQKEAMRTGQQSKARETSGRV